MAANTATSISSGPGMRLMDERLLGATTGNDSTLVQFLAAKNPSILLGTTRQGNNCLHIASLHGHKELCQTLIRLEGCLLSGTNLYSETPLIIAITRGHDSLARVFLEHPLDPDLKKSTILQQDKHGCNALHHAIRSGQEKLALKLIEVEPQLSQHVNKFNESAMFMAVMRDLDVVFSELVKIPDSSHVGQFGFNILHAAVRNDNPKIARIIMEMRPELAREGNMDSATPLRMAVHCGKIKVVKELLRKERSLGYEMHEKISPLLNCAAHQGHVDVAQELLHYCPDAPYCQLDGFLENDCKADDSPKNDCRADDSHQEYGKQTTPTKRKKKKKQAPAKAQTCLHIAVLKDHTKFVKFVLTTPHLRILVNMQDHAGKTALHYAVQRCQPEIVAALLAHKDIDTSILDNKAKPAAWQLCIVMYRAKTITWNEVWMLMVKGSQRDTKSLKNIHDDTKQQVLWDSRNKVRSLTQTYTTNTSLVAILIATITFAAAFTLPGGYSSDAGSEGLPIMSKKFAFQAFLISDTLAMCSSFAVAFICIISRWEDYEFLIYYRSFTKKLMWFAYMATTTAFSTGLYTVLAPRLHWLAIAICVLVALLPILTFLLGNWPILKLMFKLCRSYKCYKTFKSDILDMV